MFGSVVQLGIRDWNFESPFLFTSCWPIHLVSNFSSDQYIYALAAITDIIELSLGILLRHLATNLSKLTTKKLPRFLRYTCPYLMWLYLKVNGFHACWTDDINTTARIKLPSTFAKSRFLISSVALNIQFQVSCEMDNNERPLGRHLLF